MSPLVLTLNASGYPVRWSTWEEAVISKVKGLIAWSLGDETLYRGGKSRLTGERSGVTIPSIIAIKGLNKVTRRTPALTNRNLFGRDRHICAYCGNEFQSHQLTRDHIVPVSRSGLNTWMNVVSACRGCNSYKDDNLLQEIDMPLVYVPYVPCRTEALILANRQILADQMTFLSTHLPKHSRILL